MFKCQWCECELSEPEVYCPDCIEMLNATLELSLATLEDNDGPND